MWVDGVLGGDGALPQVTASARYGVSVFDAARAVWDGGAHHVIALDRHLTRLRASCEAIGLPLGRTDAELVDAIGEVLRAAPRGCWGVRVFVHGVGEDLLSGDSSVSVFLLPLTALPGPPRLALGPAVRAARGDVPRQVKTPAGYLLARLAVRAAKAAGYDDVAYLNEHDRITEASRASLLLVGDDGLQAPPVEEGVLDGVTRGVVAELARADGIGWTERPITRDDLATARGVLLTSSSIGVVPVASVDGCDYGLPAAARRVCERYHEVHLDPRFDHLVTRIPGGGA